MILIEVLALDIDGVLTDGTVSLKGDDKRISFHDLDAVTQARGRGLRLALVTGEDNVLVDEIAARFRIDEVTKGAKDKVAALRALSARWEIPLGAFCYVGDSDRDGPAMAMVGLGVAPANGTVLAKEGADVVVSRPGGSGVVSQVLPLIWQHNQLAEQSDGMRHEMQRIAQDSLVAHQRFIDESLPMLVQVAQAMIQSIRTGHKILFFGNGGSAADAQHVAGELIGRFLQESEPWPAIALTTDSSILTAVGNDWDFVDVFARQVRGLARPGDMVVGISTSGNSPNVLRGLADGRKIGATTIGFTGEKPCQMPDYCDICYQAPSSATPRIQELHILAWHAICEIVENAILGDSDGLTRMAN